MPLNIFVLGLDDPGSSELAALPNAEQYKFHGLLTFEELQGGVISFEDLLEETQEKLDSFSGSIDAIVGYWDFPVSMMVPILCKKYGLPSKSLEAVVKCEHKYWSRLEQQKVIEEYPSFALIDVDDPDATLPTHMSFPVWLKPIKSFSSEGAHQARNEEELQDALAIERETPERVGGAFDTVLEMLPLPDDIDAISGGAYMVEEAAQGKQYTVEGYSHGDQVVIIGIIDAINYEQAPSFLRYQYPSKLPEPVQNKIRDVTRRVISAVRLWDSTFNIEYFWDESSERLVLLEINTRHSQSHSQLFHRVDGLSNHEAMIDLALGREPRKPSRDGGYAMAAKWMWRHFSDGIVKRVPTDEEVAVIEQRYPGTTIEIAVEAGAQLSDADSEDSYSYSLAEIFTAGDDAEQLQALYEHCRAALDLRVDDIVEGD